MEEAAIDAEARAAVGVIVTASGLRATGWVRVARRLGHPTVRLSATRIAPAADRASAAARLAGAMDADRLVFVSPNAVAHAFALLPSLAVGARTIVLAPGLATQRALARRGVLALAPLAQKSAEGLLALPALADVAGRSVALIGGGDGRALLCDALVATGARVERVAVYRRVPSPIAARQLAGLAALPPSRRLLLSSVEALGHLRTALGARFAPSLGSAGVVASSARVADAAAAAGLRVVIVARSAERRHMLAALQRSLDHYASAQPRSAKNL